MKTFEGVSMPCCPVCDNAIFNYHRTDILEHDAMKALVHADCLKEDDEDWMDGDDDETDDDGDDDED